MILTIFDEMKSGVFGVDAFISIFVCLFTIALVALVTFYLLKYIPKINRYKRELKNAERVAALSDALNVEGEVVSIHEEKQTRWDIQYTATIVYYVGQITYYGEFTFLNCGSLRVGTKIGLLCDSSDYSSAAAANGSQISALKKLISIRLSGMIFGLAICFVFYMWVLGCLAGRSEAID